jgi:hypothetical protein
MIDASIAHGMMLKDPMRLACRDVGPDATAIKRPIQRTSSRRKEEQLSTPLAGGAASQLSHRNSVIL